MLTTVRDRGYPIVALLAACTALLGIALWATVGGNSRQVETGKAWTVRPGVAAIALVALPLIVSRAFSRRAHVPFIAKVAIPEAGSVGQIPRPITGTDRLCSNITPVTCTMCCGTRRA